MILLTGKLLRLCNAARAFEACALSEPLRIVVGSLELVASLVEFARAIHVRGSGFGE